MKILFILMLTLSSIDVVGMHHGNARQDEASNKMFVFEKPYDPRSKKRRRHTQIACVPCRKAHTACDETKPCSRCISRQIRHLCVTSEHENETNSPIKKYELPKTSKKKSPARRDPRIEKQQDISKYQLEFGPNDLKDPIPKNTRMKRQDGYVSNACVPCRIGHAKCSDNRPCDRCVKQNRECLAIEETPTNSRIPEQREPRESKKDVSREDNLAFLDDPLPMKSEKKLPVKKGPDPIAKKMPPAKNTVAGLTNVTFGGEPLFPLANYRSQYQQPVKRQDDDVEVGSCETTFCIKIREYSNVVTHQESRHNTLFSNPSDLTVVPSSSNFVQYDRRNAYPHYANEVAYLPNNEVDNYRGESFAHEQPRYFVNNDFSRQDEFPGYLPENFSHAPPQECSTMNQDYYFNNYYGYAPQAFQVVENTPQCGGNNYYYVLETQQDFSTVNYPDYAGYGYAPQYMAFQPAQNHPANNNYGEPEVSSHFSTVNHPDYSQELNQANYPQPVQFIEYNPYADDGEEEDDDDSDADDDDDEDDDDIQDNQEPPTALSKKVRNNFFGMPNTVVCPIQTT